MKKFLYKIIIGVVILLSLTGCSYLYNLNNFVIPNDTEFISVIQNLTTPRIICNYMKENFEHEMNLWSCYSPYQMWLVNLKTRAGDCNDMSCFASFVANYHGYETYQIHVIYEGDLISHFLCVFVENDRYTYSSNFNYVPLSYINTFENVVNHYLMYQTKKLKEYVVYNYNNNIIERGYNDK